HQRKRWFLLPDSCAFGRARRTAPDAQGGGTDLRRCRNSPERHCLSLMMLALPLGRHSQPQNWIERELMKSHRELSFAESSVTPSAWTAFECQNFPASALLACFA